MANGTCSVAGCGKPIKRKSLCYGHYMKQWRYGTPTPDFPPKWEDIRGQRFGALTVTAERDGRFWVCVCDCGAVVQRTLNGLRLSGDASACGKPGGCMWRVAAPGYGAAHDRVRSLRGSATEHRCVDCDAPAAHWSYNHDDPDELTGIVSGYRVTYSAHPDHYSPRCVPCHKRFDLDKQDALPVSDFS